MDGKSQDSPDCVPTMFSAVCQPYMDGMKRDIIDSVAGLREESRISSEASRDAIAEVHNRIDRMLEVHIIPMANKVHNGFGDEISSVSRRLDRVDRRVWWLVGTMFTLLLTAVGILAAVLRGAR